MMVASEAPLRFRLTRLQVHSLQSTDMTRRNLILSLATATAAASEKEAPVSDFHAKRVARTFAHTVGAPAADVFPLLCPVIEYKWLEGWQCELVYSASGVAEENCIFITDFPDTGHQVWTVSRYEPPRRVEFVTSSRDLATRLDIRIEERGGRTALTWTRLYTGLNASGNELADLHDEEWNQQLGARLHAAITHYLETGEMLVSQSGRASRPSPAPHQR